jgi:zinc D-Ala-D-Ala dipeptidase
MSPARLALSMVTLALVTACAAGEPPPVAPSSPPPSATPGPSVVPTVDSHAPPGFVSLSDVDSTILEDIRYLTDHNFVGRRIDGYLEPRCVLTDRAAQALRRAQDAARAKGYSLKVYDCYRPLRAGEDFKAWAQLPDAQAMKAEFFPELAKSAVFTEGYVSSGRSAHSRGSTVDLTLVALPARTQRPFVAGEPLTPCTAPAGERFPDNTIDMGTGYDCFDPRSHPLDPRITGPAKQNRLLLRQLMTGAGFRGSSSEWWHYSLVADPFPDTYFDFPVARAALE